MGHTTTQQQKIALERVRVLYSNGRFAVAGVLVGALFLALFLWERLDARLWWLWLSVVAVINVSRLLLVESFLRKLRRGAIDKGSVSRWERRFFVGVLFSSLSWGVVGLFPFQQELLLSLVFTALLLIALSAASIVTLVTSLAMGLLFLSATMLPLIARCLLTLDTACWILGLACLAYYVIFTQMACRLHHIVIDNIHLKFENEELSLKDALTGLWNRRQLYLFIDQLQSRADRSGEGFSLILMDLDHFKEYNDSHGHNAGDELLVSVAEVIREASREEDLPVRYGGEEFLLVLPRAGLQQAAQVAERIRHALEQKTGCSLSAGIAVYGLQESFDKLIAKADKALYLAKSQGRNRVIAYGSPGLSAI